MTGERLAWFRVASHLGMTIGQLRERITLSEFFGWLQFLEWERDSHSKLDHYLAQIAAEIQRGHVKTPKKVKLETFLLQFSKEKASMRKSKAAWAKALKIELK